MQNTNSLKDEINLQQQKLKGESLLKKLEYFWYYYKVHTIIAFLSICMFGNIFYSIATKKETVLSIAFVNTSLNVESEFLTSNFEKYLGLNQKKQQVVLDSAFQINNDFVDTYSQKFSTKVMAGMLDVVLGDESAFDFYGTQGFFQDLSTIFSEEVLSSCQKDLYYADILNDNFEYQVPIGIKINLSEEISSTNTTVYFGILTGTKHTDIAISYLNYLKRE